MTNQSLEDILVEIRQEREACERVMVQLRTLGDHVLEELFQVMLEQCCSTSLNEATGVVRQVINEQLQLNIAANTVATTRINELTDELKVTVRQAKQVEQVVLREIKRLRRIQRWNTGIVGFGFCVVLVCGLLMGWSGYNYWFMKQTISALWFQRIFINNREVFEQCLKPEVIRRTDGKCTIQLPVKAK